MKYYSTVRAALCALAQDVGFNPFITGHEKGRPTKARLAGLGYVVDARRVAEMRKGHPCSVCQEEVKQRYDGLRNVWPTECEKHFKWVHRCDNGHQWGMTIEEEKIQGFQCPHCSEYSQ